jgi:hypothetical protein
LSASWAGSGEVITTKASASKTADKKERRRREHMTYKVKINDRHRQKACGPPPERRVWFI